MGDTISNIFYGKGASPGVEMRSDRDPPVRAIYGYNTMYRTTGPKMSADRLMLGCMAAFARRVSA